MVADRIGSASNKLVPISDPTEGNICRDLGEFVDRHDGLDASQMDVFATFYKARILVWLAVSEQKRRVIHDCSFEHVFVNSLVRCPDER
jgi:hypothetical protein